MGSGRLPKEEVLLEHILHTIARPKDLAGVRVAVTAGPTQEALDPVRYLTNHSTGKMGYAIARAAAGRVALKRDFDPRTDRAAAGQVHHRCAGDHRPADVRGGDKPL